MNLDPDLRIHELVARQAAQRPESMAIIDADGSTYNYAQYQAAILEASMLLQEYGARPDDRVLLVSENCMASAVFIFAASVIGAYAIPVNARMTASEIKRVMDHAVPSVTIYTSGVSAEAASHAETAKAVRLKTGVGHFSIVAGNASNPSSADAHGTAVILYTTGTTGAPKGVMLSHGNLNFTGRTSAALRELVPEDCIYGALPLTHVFGLASMLMASSVVGASVQLETRFQPQRVYSALKKGVTVFPGVPQMHALVMHYTKEQGYTQLEGSQLRYVSSGAAPLDPAWKRKAEAFYRLPLQNGYGMTESTAGICSTCNTIGSEDTSVGPSMPDIEIRIDTAISGSTEVGTGEIMTRGPHVMKGYYNNPDETAKAIDSEGWLRTGDLGRIDVDGNLHVVGRCKELIIRGGFNVYPPEVEAALNDHSMVIQSAVIGRLNDKGDEEVLAFVQCSDPGALNIQALTEFVAERLASYKRPSRIIACTELPAAATGKILKHKLLSTFATQLAEL